MSEMPQINYGRFNGKKYSYFYSLTRRDDFLAQLVNRNNRLTDCSNRYLYINLDEM